MTRAQATGWGARRETRSSRDQDAAAWTRAEGPGRRGRTPSREPEKRETRHGRELEKAGVGGCSGQARQGRSAKETREEGVLREVRRQGEPRTQNDAMGGAARRAGGVPHAGDLRERETRVEELRPQGKRNAALEAGWVRARLTESRQGRGRAERTPRLGASVDWREQRSAACWGKEEAQLGITTAGAARFFFLSRAASGR